MIGSTSARVDGVTTPSSAVVPMDDGYSLRRLDAEIGLCEVCCASGLSSTCPR